MKRAAVFCIIAALLIPIFQVFIVADETPEYSYPVGGINCYPKNNFITVYTPEYGDKYEGSEAYSTYEIAVSSGKIVAVGQTRTAIPKDGYLAVVRGNKLTEKIKSLNLAIGDSVVFDRMGKQIMFINESYSPFYENVIHFDKFNSTRTADTIVIYNNGKTTNTNMWGYEVTVDADGFVCSVGGNNNEIPEGGYVVSAVGRERIAELTEAASVGLIATVDAEKKTVTFAFNRESIAGEMKVKYNDFSSSVEKSKSVYSNLDYSVLDEVCLELKALYEKGRSSNMAEAMTAKVEFEEKYNGSLHLLIENPAAESRTIWIRPNDSFNRNKVNETVKKIYEAGFNTICIEMLYNSVTIFPVDTEKYMFSQNPEFKGFDVLEAYIEECHKYGIEVFGWMVCYRISHGGTTYPDLAVTTKKPEWLNKAKSGTTDVGDTKGHFLNPALPEVSEFLLEFYEYIFKTYALDGFQLDYIRYPVATGEEFGYDDYTRQLFKDQYGTDPVNISNGGRLWNEWCAFRCSFVTEFVKKVKTLINEIRPDMYLGAAYAPDLRNSDKTHMQEAKKWLSEGIIDVGFPMAYGTGIVPLYSSLTTEAAGEKAYSYIGIGDYGVDILKREIVETRDAGAEGFAFFAIAQYFGGNYHPEMMQTMLKERSCSPTFNSTEALYYQFEFIKERLNIIKKLSPEKLSAETENAVMSVVKMIEKCEYKTAEEYASAIENAIQTVSFANGDKTVSDVLVKDLKKALKISNHSKDAFKNEYYKTHPMPDPYNVENRLGYSAVRNAKAGISIAKNK